MLVATSLAVVGLAIALPFSPVAKYLGFVSPPPVFFVILGVTVLAYLLLVEWVKARYVHSLARTNPRRHPT